MKKVIFGGEVFHLCAGSVIVEGVNDLGVILGGLTADMKT